MRVHVHRGCFFVLLGYLRTACRGSMDFSHELIQRLISYFTDKYGVLLTPEEAQTYLAALAELYGGFRSEAVPGALAPGQPAPDLITPHSCN